MNDKLENLVPLLRDGDEKAFRAIYDLYKDKLYFFSLKFTKSPEASEEIVQEVFIKIWKNKHNIKPELPFNAYIFTATKNSILNFLQRLATEQKTRKAISYMMADMQNSEPEISLLDKYEEGLQKAIAKLPPKRQAIFRLAKQEGLSYEQIAAEMGIAKNTVRLQIVFANKFIKAFLLDYRDH